MNTEQVSKEIKVRLNKVCSLLKEIEDILCNANNEVQSSECICVCGKQSIPEIIETLSNHCVNDDSRKCEKMQQSHVTCSEKRAKFKDLGGEKMSSGVNDISPCCRRNNKQNHEKNNTNDLCCNNISNNKQFDNNSRYNECRHEKFTNKIKDINQKVMLYFDEKNKNKPNTSIGSTIKSKKTSRFCSS